MLIALCLTALMILVMALDLRTYTIPNWLNAVVLCLFIVAALIAPKSIDWLQAGMALGVVFLVGLAMFSFRLMGGGDIKLLCALASWCGWGEPLVQMVFYVAIFGGILSVVLYMARLIYPWFIQFVRPLQTRPAPRVLSPGEPVPYGIAIALGFLSLLWMDKIILAPIS